MIVFILSSGRTGTVFISKVMSALPGVSSCHERRGRIARLLNFAKSDFRESGAFDKILGALICKELLKISRKKDLHFEINNMMSNFPEDVYRKFPEAVYIHLVRDPRDYIRSAINWTLSKPLNKFFLLHFPFWAPRPDKYLLGNDDISKLFEIFTGHWVRANENYLRLKNRTKKYYLLKFEDLNNDPAHFFEEILKITDFQNWRDVKPIMEKLIKKTPKNESKKIFNSWPRWEDKYTRHLNGKCGELMGAFGYGAEDDWQNRLFNKSDK